LTLAINQGKKQLNQIQMEKEELLQQHNMLLESKSAREDEQLKLKRQLQE